METDQSIESHSVTVVQFLLVLVHDIFFASFLLYLLAFFIEGLERGAVVSVINMNTILLICIGSGLLLAFFGKEELVHTKKSMYGVVTVLAGIIGGTFIYQSVHETMSQGILLSIAGSILISFLGCATLFLDTEKR